MSRYTWEDVARYAARHGVEVDDLPSPEELWKDDREAERRRDEQIRDGWRTT